MSTKSRRERERHERKEVILKAARELFFKDGFEKTTMPKIAKVTELATGTLYLYFPSKESIYVELLYEGYDLLLKELKSVIDPVLLVKEQAKRLMETFLNFAKAHPEYFQILFFVVQREGKGVLDINLTEDQNEKLKKYQDEIARVSYESLVKAGMKEEVGEIENSVAAVWSMLAGVILYYLKDGDDVFDRVKSAAENIILRGLFGD